MKKIFNTEKAPAPVGPYNQAIQFGSLLFVSGQIAINPSNGQLITSDIAAETHQVLQNIGEILKNAGLGFGDVLKCTVFVKNMEDYGKINSVYAEYFDEGIAPARELVEVTNLPKFVNIEISVIAGS